jgi:OmpA-OmpF porin, OOP family
MARRPPWRWFDAGLAALLSWGLQVEAVFADVPPANPGFHGPLDRLDPAPAADTFFTVPSADVAGQLRPGASLFWSFARDPLVLRSSSPMGSPGEPQRVVGHQMLLHTLASVEIAERVKLDIDVPFTLHQSGTSVSIGRAQVTSPSGASVNDVRAGARVQVLRQDGLLPAAAMAFSAWIPSGDEHAFAGSASARFEPQVIVGAKHPHVLWSLSLGLRFQPPATGSLIGSQTLVGAAVAARLGALQVGPEVSLGWDARDAELPAEGEGLASKFLRSSFSAEALLGVRYALGPFTLGAGGGPGFGRAPGTPTYRLFASLGYANDFRRAQARPSATRTAPKASGSAGAEAAGKGPRDAAPAIASDRDGDTVPDGQDACPTLVGDATPGAFQRGCPLDRDRDGIFDVDDRCPEEAGALSEDPAKNGCPADSDGDGIADAKDACPKEKGKPTEDPATNGCPLAVRVESAQIVILQQVTFETGRDEIKKDSFDLLGQVASAIKEHPEIARVAVDGHTDNQGSAKANLNLSQRRAVAVVRWLSDHGIDARRLETRGFGPRRPIADNATRAGRAKNRRVEFLIRRRSKDGEAGWRDGPVE